MAQNEADLDLDVEAAEASPKKAGWLKYVLFGVAAVVLLSAITFTALYFTGLLTGSGGSTAEASATPAKAAEHKQAEHKKPEHKVPKGPLEYLPLDPPFVVNFAGDSDARFLQVAVEVSSRDPAALDMVKAQMPAIRNNLVLLFSSQNSKDLQSRAGKEKLRAEVLTEVRKALIQQAGATGDAGINNVYFTSFVMQ